MTPESEIVPSGATASETATNARVPLPEFPIERVETVYIGRRRGCRCGCLGKYYVLAQNEKRADAARGYACPDDVNDAMVRRVVNRLRREGIDADGIHPNGLIFTLTLESGREWSIYLFPPTPKA